MLRNLFFSIVLLVFLANFGYADTVIFKDGRRLDVTSAWHDGDKIKMEMYGGIVSYDESEVKEFIRDEPQRKKKHKPKVEQTTKPQATGRGVANKSRPVKNKDYFEYSGTGDSVVTIQKPNKGKPALAIIQGNRGEGHFAIIGYDDSGNKTEFLVNTTKSYNGIVPIDLGSGLETTQLEVRAKGHWKIDVIPIGAATKVDVPGNFEAVGDNVIWLNDPPKTMSLVGNSGGNHLSAVGYDKYGRRVKLLVNTTEAYNGKVMVPRNTLLIEVQATGRWVANFN